MTSSAGLTLTTKIAGFERAFATIFLLLTLKTLLQCTIEVIIRLCGVNDFPEDIPLQRKVLKHARFPTLNDHLRGWYAFGQRLHRLTLDDLIMNFSFFLASYFYYASRVNNLYWDADAGGEMMIVYFSLRVFHGHCVVLGIPILRTIFYVGGHVMIWVVFIWAVHNFSDGHYLGSRFGNSIFIAAIVLLGGMALITFLLAFIVKPPEFRRRLEAITGAHRDEPAAVVEAPGAGAAGAAPPTSVTAPAAPPPAAPPPPPPAPSRLYPDIPTETTTYGDRREVSTVDQRSRDGRRRRGDEERGHRRWQSARRDEFGAPYYYSSTYSSSERYGYG